MISVSMCTYNGAKHIREQLESITEQSVQPDEIIICDDGSSDDTIKIAKEILAEWSGKSKVIKNEVNLGFSKNFIKAIELCEGDIIFLCDQDDVWHKEKIAIMTDMLAKHQDALLVVHDSLLVDEKRHVLNDSFWRYLTTRTLSAIIIVACLWEMLFRDVHVHFVRSYLTSQSRFPRQLATMNG